MASFVRAFSPIAGATLVGRNDQHEGSQIARHTVLQGAATVDELISLIPSDYRVVLREPLMGVRDTIIKLVAARNLLAKYEQHKAAGTFPSILRSKAPEYQMSKDFGSTADGAAQKAALERAHQEYLALNLNNIIRAKSDEVTFLDNATKPDALFKELLPIVKSQGEYLVKHTRVPTWEPIGDTGEVQLGPLRPSAATIELAQHMQEDVVVYAYRVVCITEMQEHVKTIRFQKKVALKKDADVEMTDATGSASTDRSTIQSMVDKAVAAQMKAQNKKTPKSGKGKKVDKKGKSSSSQDTKPWKQKQPGTPYVPKPAKAARVSAVRGGQPQRGGNARGRGGKGKRGKGRSG
ncbi:hypothetical protein BDZ94DRAFT_1312906 [Collybia nuda]|uniref:Uncharacterized protein n=1 Tax=Collybia nuda TaxID=64659 RepID=A0A9P5Y050_9AGAR|nr:hypothetical protein BDZ94DRAFT_1312906 [Collybia nuda]